ncbi:MAG: cell division protein FtsA [Minisyncoccia bacterium]
MKQEFTTGIDIGTHAIKIVIAEMGLQNTPPKIIHAIQSPSHGFRHGYIADIETASKSLKTALKKIETLSKNNITHARFSIGGAGLSAQYVRTSIAVDEKDNEISERHITGIMQKAENLFVHKYPNKKILHIIPVRYQVDGQDVLGNPIGMYGESLEVKINFVTILEHHYDSLVQVIDSNGIHIQDLVAAPVADASAALNYRQKSQGCILANIGSETTSLVTFDNGIMTSLQVNTIGSNDITNDIALGMQTSLDDAENIKTLKNKDVSKRRVDEIIHARITDILESTENHLKKLRKNRLLPAGIIFTGGGSKIDFLEDYAKKFLHLGAEKILVSKYSKKTKRNKSIGSEFSVAYGLCFNDASHQDFKTNIFSFKKIKHFLKNIFTQITP